MNPGQTAASEAASEAVAVAATETEWRAWEGKWEALVGEFAAEKMRDADPGHDVAHVRRVVLSTERIGKAEGAQAAVAMPAAWLHDCVVVAKDSPLRSQASRLAAERAEEFLSSIDYPPELIPAIAHAVIAHSFSANIAPESIEAKVVQDADRLEAIGALGLARCLMTGGAMGTQLLHAKEPFPVLRAADDAASSIDHLFVKLLRLPQRMQTATGKSMAEKRVGFLELFLRELAEELDIDPAVLDQALAIVRKQRNF
jgi:uncharacterized protein